MAKNRWLNTKFWSDNFVVDLNPLDRYLFLYLLLNEHTNICGIYELPLKIMSNETGIEKEMLIMMLKNLIGKVYYVDGWVAIRNFEKHQSTTSDDTMKGIAREKANIPEKIWVKIEEAFCGNVPPKVSYGEPKAPYREPDILNLTSPNLTLPYLTLPNSAIAEKENQKIQNILSWYKEKIASGSRMTPASKDKILTRLKIWSEDDLIKAIVNFSKDKWWMDNNAGRGLAWFFHSDDRIDGFVNMKPKVATANPGVYIARDENGEIVNDYSKNIIVAK